MYLLSLKKHPRKFRLKSVTISHWNAFYWQNEYWHSLTKTLFDVVSTTGLGTADMLDFSNFLGAARRLYEASRKSGWFKKRNKISPQAHRRHGQTAPRKTWYPGDHYDLNFITSKLQAFKLTDLLVQYILNGSKMAWKNIYTVLLSEYMFYMLKNVLRFHPRTMGKKRLYHH